jgi:glycosyltransferase involved in cell wall biosynthesis
MATDRIAIAYDCLFPYTTGGGERLYRSYAEQLTDRGVDVTYLTALQWDEDLVPTRETGFSITPIVGRIRLYDDAGVRRFPAALRFAAGLFTALIRRRRDFHAIIVSGLPVLNVLAARAALVGSGTQVIVDYLEVWGRRQWVAYAGPAVGNIAWALQRIAIAVTPTATCHSRLTARQLEREGFRGTLLLSPGLIDGESRHRLTSDPAHPPYVLYAGRHIPDKRVEFIPAAVAAARRRIPDLRLVLLGSGPSTADVDEAIREAEAESWTERPGFVSDDRLAELMGNAAVLVNPSRREGYGLVVVEAGAHGTPVVLVADDSNAATELVETGVNGFVSPTARPDDLADAIVRAVEGGVNLRRRARSWYEVSVKTRTVARTVDGILAEIRSGDRRPEIPHRPSDVIEGPQ